MQDDLLIPGLTDYIQGIFPRRDEIFLEIEASAEKDDFPIVGPLVGHFLMHYAFLLKPKRILELGSGYGYSALWFAKATKKSTEIICTDISNKNSKKAKQYFERMGVADKIKFYVGDALEIMDQIDGNFDIIFNDIDKQAYPLSLPAIKEKLRPGGVLIIDNMLWHGRIFDNADQSPDTRGVRNFTGLITGDPDWIVSLVPIRDGMIIAYKK